MSGRTPQQQAGVGLRGSLRSVWDSVRRRLGGDRLSETFVRHALLGQAGVAAVESVNVIPGSARRRQLLVRIRVAEGCDAGDVMRDATEMLFRHPSVVAVRLLAYGGDGPDSGV